MGGSCSRYVLYFIPSHRHIFVNFSDCVHRTHGDHVRLKVDHVINWVGDLPPRSALSCFRYEGGFTAAFTTEIPSRPFLAQTGPAVCTLYILSPFTSYPNLYFYSFHFCFKYASLICHVNEPGTVASAVVTTKFCFPDSFLGNPSPGHYNFYS